MEGVMYSPRILSTSTLLTNLSASRLVAKRRLSVCRLSVWEPHCTTRRYAASASASSQVRRGYANLDHRPSGRAFDLGEYSPTGSWASHVKPYVGFRALESATAQAISRAQHQTSNIKHQTSNIK